MTANDIKTLRDQLSLTQAELATRINEIDSNLRIAASTVSRWECGHHAPSPHVAAALAQLATQAPAQPVTLTLSDITCPGCGQVAFFREYGDARYERPILIANDDPANQPTLASVARTTRLMPTNIECYGCGYRLSDEHAAKIWDAIRWSPDDALAEGYPCLATLHDGRIKTAILTTQHAASSYGAPVAVIDGVAHGYGDLQSLSLSDATAANSTKSRFT